ncbi:NlpC/P60 family protein [Thalassobacillus cyri]|uniref:NlpC/P60 family protein n=1 Tax=Thalassobacillus cyri TaxID=571932 RepID=A0A1H4HDQ9_9BACI|nr:C40 family peptidase [Thalassobacillus cyri]SEB19590.1 NlpC/P60 family protein [Thalassobacillus cyri]
MLEETHENYIVSVTAATVWTAPTSPRELDEPGLSNPVNLNEWLKRLTREKRLELCDENLVQSQLLYGEEVMVTDKNNGWAHVIIPTQPSKKDERGYPGWVPLAQLQPITTQLWETDKTAVVSSKKTVLKEESGNEILELSYMTMLPVQEVLETSVRVSSPHGSAYIPREDSTIFAESLGMKKENGVNIVRLGEAFIGLPYFWGGMSAYGYDCSGFAYNMHKAAGYQIPRDASDQAKAGEEISFDHLMPGDLLFFAYEEGQGNIHHVGIYYGDGKMLHSPSTGKGIEVRTLGGTIYEKELCAARRYWQETEEPA